MPSLDRSIIKSGKVLGNSPTRPLTVPPGNERLMRYAFRLAFVCSVALMMMASGALAQTPVSTYEVLNTFPHDTSAFTEGLVYTDGALYESTGLYGSSTLRQVDLRTGTVLRSVSLAGQYFGEGATLFQGKIFQLT